MKKRKFAALIHREEKFEKLARMAYPNWWNTFGCDVHGYYIGEKERFDFGTYEVNRDTLHQNHKVAHAILRKIIRYSWHSECQEATFAIRLEHMNPNPHGTKD